jgi:hypothetical protein
MEIPCDFVAAHFDLCNFGPFKMILIDIKFLVSLAMHMVPHTALSLPRQTDLEETFSQDFLIFSYVFEQVLVWAFGGSLKKGSGALAKTGPV